MLNGFTDGQTSPSRRKGWLRLGPAAAAKAERSRAVRVAASTVANRLVRRRRLVVRVSPRPSACAGAPIERRFERVNARESEGGSEGMELSPGNIVTLRWSVG